MVSVPAEEPPMSEEQKTDLTNPDVVAVTSVKPAKAAPKSATVVKMLSRGRGATLTEVVEATNLKAHSARAFFSGLRKRGLVLIREERKNGDNAYRIAKRGLES